MSDLRRRLVLLYFPSQGSIGAFMEEEKKIKFPTTGTYDFIDIPVIGSA